MNKKIKSQPQNSQKLSSLMMISHEFRAPLHSIIGFSKLLQKNGGSNQEMIQKILDNSLHLLNLANGIIEIGKESSIFDETLHTQDVQLPDLIHHVLDMFAGQSATKGIELNTEFPAEINSIQTDSEKMKIIIANVISNAIKFTEKGAIKTRLITSPQNDPQRIEVQDTGKGIPQEILPKLLEPFSLKEEKKWEEGYGLGLGITRTLCDQLGYRLEAESKVGKGSTFRIIL